MRRDVERTTGDPESETAVSLRMRWHMVRMVPEPTCVLWPAWPVCMREAKETSDVAVTALGKSSEPAPRRVRVATVDRRDKRATL